VTDVTLDSVNKIAIKYSLEKVTESTVRSVFGLNKEESSQKFFPNLKLEEALKLMDEFEDLKLETLKERGGNIYPNTESILKELSKEYELFIVSNTARNEYIESFITQLDYEKYFKDYVAASLLGVSKGDAIKKVVETNNLERAVYVGDTKKDLEAASLAGIPFIQARYGFGEELQTEYYINDIVELPNVVENIKFIK